MITGMAAANALGLGVPAMLAALQDEQTGLQPNDFAPAPLPTWIGRVTALEQVHLAPALATFDCRNNRLAQMGLQQDVFGAAVAGARARYGAGRIGVFMGTSTSGILTTELGYRQLDAHGQLPAIHYRGTQNLFSLADFVRRYLHLSGPAVAISTACSSSAKVFASAWRHIQAGLCDAAVVGGVDSLCLTTLYGFHSLGLLSDEICRPFDVRRKGISIGEAAGFMLLERQPQGEGDVGLLGYGESSDAYHMSTPDPDGAGARLAMEQALARAGLQPADVDYINLHGTGTQANDTTEDTAIAALFGSSVPCSSTKGWTGHTLGAAGITEAILTALCLRHGMIPRSLNLETPDARLSCSLVRATEHRPIRYAMSNSFGFGGSNCSLLLGKVAA